MAIGYSKAIKQNDNKALAEYLRKHAPNNKLLSLLNTENAYSQRLASSGVDTPVSFAVESSEEEGSHTIFDFISDYYDAMGVLYETPLETRDYTASGLDSVMNYNLDTKEYPTYANTKANSFSEWLAKKGVSDDENYATYYGAAANKLYEAKKAELDRQLQSVKGEASQTKQGQSVTAHSDYTAATADYGKRANYLAAVGLADSGSKLYRDALSGERLQNDLQIASEKAKETVGAATEDYSQALAKLDSKRIDEINKKQQSYQNEYEDYLGKVDEKNDKMRYKQYRNMNTLFNQMLNNYTDFNPYEVEQYLNSNLITQDQFDYLGQVYGAIVLEQIRQNGTFTGRYATAQEMRDYYLNLPLIVGEGREAIQKEFENTKKTCFAGQAYIINPHTDKQMPMGNKYAETTLEDLMDCITVGREQNTVFVYTDHDLDSFIYRVDSKVNYYGFTEETKKESERIVKAQAENGEATMAIYKGFIYITDGDRIFQIKQMSVDNPLVEDVVSRLIK